MTKYLIYFLLITSLYSKPQYSLEHEISQILLLGFDGTMLEDNNSIKADIQAGLGAVILFDKQHYHKELPKNITGPKQLKNLLTQLQTLTKQPLLICIDQEGGQVRRLKNELGFFDLPSALSVGDKDDSAYSQTLYKELANEFDFLGINCVFAPVVDLASEPKNPIIYQMERSYSSRPEIVVKHAEIFMDAMKSKHIFSIIKHFPGHGSSLSDSHKGFVDVSATWKERELEPFAKIIDHKKVDMIMSAHIFNKNLDASYPATMSYATNTNLLKKKMGYKGLMISDGMQMHAISKNFSIDVAVEKTLNSGVDILLFANQLDRISRKELVVIIKKLINQGRVSEQSIRDKAQRVRDYKVKVFKALKV